MMADLPKLNKAQSVYFDFMRAAAAMTVLFGHAALLFQADSFLEHINFQKIGVMIFFLLSGFLITYSALRKYDSEDYGFKEFFIDRFSRIYCAYIPALIFVWVIDSLTLTHHIAVPPDRLHTLKYMTDLQTNHDLKTWIGNIFMIQDFPLFQIVNLLGFGKGPWFVDEYGSASPFWSVAVEWWIYLGFGVAVLLHLRDRTKFKLWQLAIVGFVAIVPFYYCFAGPQNCLSLLWIIGMGACYFFLKMPAHFNVAWPEIPSSWMKGAAMLLLAALVAMVGRAAALKIDTGEIPFDEFQFSTFVAVALFSGAFLLSGVKHVPMWLEKVVGFVANYSFSLYLIHAPIMIYMYVRFPGHDRDIKFFWLFIGIANVAAIIFSWLFERHYHTAARWLKKRYARRSGPLTSVR